MGEAGQKPVAVGPSDATPASRRHLTTVVGQAPNARACTRPQNGSYILLCGLARPLASFAAQPPRARLPAMIMQRISSKTLNAASACCSEASPLIRVCGRSTQRGVVMAAGPSQESSSFNNKLRKGFAPVSKKPLRQRSESVARQAPPMMPVPHMQQADARRRNCDYRQQQSLAQQKQHDAFI